MYCTAKGLADDYQQESENTLKLFKALSDDSLGKKIYDGGWTISQLAWHIIMAGCDMVSSVGLSVYLANENEEDITVQKIIDEYTKVSDTILNAFHTELKDEHLTDELEIWGMPWTKATILTAFMKHEIHHRAQLQMLMRSAGMPVPGMYGPSREEIDALGGED